MNVAVTGSLTSRDHETRLVASSIGPISLGSQRPRRGDLRRRVLPFYVLVDVSIEPQPHAEESDTSFDTMQLLTPALMDMLDDSPLYAGLIQIAVIDFAERASTVLHLSHPLDSLLSRLPIVQHGTNRSYAAGFGHLETAIRNDVTYLQATEHHVGRPVVLFCVTGEPSESAHMWNGALDSLLRSTDPALVFVPFVLGPLLPDTVMRLASHRQTSAVLGQWSQPEHNSPDAGSVVDAIVEEIRRTVEALHAVDHKPSILVQTSKSTRHSSVQATTPAQQPGLGTRHDATSLSVAHSARSMDPSFEFEFTYRSGRVAARPRNLQYLWQSRRWARAHGCDYPTPGQRQRLLASLAALLAERHHNGGVAGNLKTSNMLWRLDPTPQLLLRHDQTFPEPFHALSFEPPESADFAQRHERLQAMDRSHPLVEELRIAATEHTTATDVYKFGLIVERVCSPEGRLLDELPAPVSVLLRASLSEHPRDRPSMRAWHDALSPASRAPNHSLQETES
jgi:uncharacterized protein YegL